MSRETTRLAVFGHRSIPPIEGSAGADTIASEVFPRLVSKGFTVIAYNRIYGKTSPIYETYKGVKLKYIKTVNKKGFDSLLHSLKSTYHIIKYNTADTVLIANGGNSLCAILLKLFNKKVIVANDGLDWKRDKWPWYAKLYLYLSSYITAIIPDAATFDNIYAKEEFEKKFHRKYHFVPSGFEIHKFKEDEKILEELNLKKKDYFLFVGRFIPDKGLQYLIPAFEKIRTNKKLVLVGGSPNPSPFEKRLKNTNDKRIIFPGYIYGEKTTSLIKNAYAYIQPSDLEGLSPVIITVMGLGTPLICSDIRENLFIVKDMAITFKKSDIDDLAKSIEFAINNENFINKNAILGKYHIQKEFSLEKSIGERIKVINTTSN